MTAATFLGHSIRSGKNTTKSGEITVVQKPLQRGHERYVHDIRMAKSDVEKKVLVKSGWRALQKKNEKYCQNDLFLTDEDTSGPVNFAN